MQMNGNEKTGCLYVQEWNQIPASQHTQKPNQYEPNLEIKRRR